MPLLIAFPVVITVLFVVSNEGSSGLLESNLRSNLAGTRNYLDQLKAETGVRVDQMVKSERLLHLLTKRDDRGELDRVLVSTAKSSGLDFLLIAAQDGTVLGSSTGVARGNRLPNSYVIRQAIIGVPSAAYERFDAAQLTAFSPDFPQLARIDRGTPAEPTANTETRGLLINAAAHFPLAIGTPDAILLGGILLNRNYSLIEHMRQIIFPVGALPGDSEGLNALYLDDVMIAISRQREQGQRTIGEKVALEIADTVLKRGEPWLGNLDFGTQSHIVGYQPLVDGDGRCIGMISAAFPDEPYQNATRLLLGIVATLLALTMLAISTLILRTGRELTQRLSKIARTMTMVQEGDRTTRVGQPLREDELGLLSRHFDVLLDTIESQDEIRRTALRAIADEASRRRALFEHERDGVVILNPDGSVIEANPKCVAMLGYQADELLGMRITDWDTRWSPAELDRVLNDVGRTGGLFETVHRRKDGTTYAAEVAISRADWGGRTLVLVLLRDISRRKAAADELDRYRLGLEALVAQRTRELNDRSEQLDAIFALSPDGLMSFDNHHCVSFANRSFLHMTGLDAKEIIGMDELTFSDRLARKCQPHAVFPGVARLRQARQKVGTGDTAPEQGAQRLLIELVAPISRIIEVGIRLAETDNLSQILYFRDVTHETEVDRMKSEFLSTAAHELRTPMASIYGYSELLMTQDFDDEARKELLETIFRQSELMASIINELLDLARIESRRGKDFVIERLDLKDLVTTTVAGYKPPPKRSAPQFAGSATPMLIDADRRKMQQAILNIVSNAYKYSPDGGTVEIVLSVSNDDGSHRVGVTVSDSGIGMTPEQLERVCERFYRADTSGKIPGTGLGMSIVKEIIELHGGEVRIASIPGKGTSATLWLPAA
jgi:PAS domain S-box-containing protein